MKNIKQEIIKILDTRSIEIPSEYIMDNAVAGKKNWRIDQLESLFTSLLNEKIEEIEQATPRYLKGGEPRTQYYAKGWSECKEYILAILKPTEKE